MGPIERGIYFRRGAVDVKSALVTAYGDSLFANMPGEKSRGGVAPCLAGRPKEVIEGRFDLQAPLARASFPARRAARSALAAEACGVSEAMEQRQFLLQCLGGFLFKLIENQGY